MNEIIHKSGARKTAIARATLKKGEGVIRINSQLLDNFSNEISRSKIKEPLILAGESAKNVNINVRINGGGTNSQAEAARLAISRVLAEYEKKLEKIFLDYDRLLLVADVRRKEPSKPNRHGKARSKRQKSYR